MRFSSVIYGVASFQLTAGESSAFSITNSNTNNAT